MSRRDEVIDQVGGIMLSEGLKFRRDPDDDQFSMFFDSTLILIDVLGSDDYPAVRIACPMLDELDVAQDEGHILERLNAINAEYRFVKTYLSDDTIYSHYAIHGPHVNRDDFISAFRMLVSFSEEYDDALQDELGGKRAVDHTDEYDD